MRAARVALASIAAAACSPAPAASPPAPAPLVIAPIGAGAADAGATILVGDAPAPPSDSERALEEWSSKTSCTSYDYYPQGGIQSFWCHRPDRVTLAAIRELAGVDVFASGPHKNDTLVLDARSDFGRYNPAFVRWLVDKAGPSPRGSAAQRATQSAYDAKLKPLAEVFYRTYQKAKADPACFAREQKTYADLVATKRLPPAYYERWFFFMNPYFCTRPMKAGDTFYYDNGFDAGVEGNVTKTVVGFWIRRAIDGTMDTFAEGLAKLVAAYDPELAQTPYEAADATALTRAIDAGMRAAAGCRDPQARTRSVSVEIMVSPDGRLRATPRGPAGLSPAQRQCIEGAFAQQSVPAFRGAKLRFSRPVPIRP